MKSEQPFFSVVIPLYNKVAHIAQTLTSALNQTYDRFEVIVVNDGSTDRSFEVAKSFESAKVRVFTKKNGGVSDARNYGILRAQHDYIAFLDADDIWESNYLEEMASLIKKYPDCGMLSCAYKIVKQNKSLTACNGLPEGVINNFFQVRLKHHIMRTSATIVRKDVFDAVGGFPVGMIGGEDDYTWAKIAIKYKVAFTPKVLVAYNHIYSTITFRKGKLDHCKESWFDFYEAGNFYRNEYIASKAIHAGIRYALGMPQNKSVEIERRTRFTHLSRKKWRYLFILNRAPYNGIRLFLLLKTAYRAGKSWLQNKLPVFSASETKTALINPS